MACHSDTALKLLRGGGSVTEQEERILGQFEWRLNEAEIRAAMSNTQVMNGMVIPTVNITMCPPFEMQTITSV